MLSTIEAKSAEKAEYASRVSPSRRAADWLLERIQKGRKEPFSEIVTLTPDIAEILLANNADNRSPKQSLVNTFATDIQSGKWDLNGETIVVAKDGALNDGQHRCLAVVQAGKPIKTAIMFGVERDTRYTVDMGAARTVGDFIAMEGGTYVNVGATVAKFLNLHRRGYDNWQVGGNTKSSSHAPTKVMVRQEYWNCQKEIVAAIQNCERGFIKKFGTASLATAYVLIARKNPVECAVFFRRLVDGVGLRRGDAALALRNRIMQEVSARGSAPQLRMRPHHKTEMIIRYWNAYRRGKSIIGGLQIIGKIPQIES